MPCPLPLPPKSMTFFPSKTPLHLYLAPRHLSNHRFPPSRLPPPLLVGFRILKLRPIDRSVPDPDDPIDCPRNEMQIKVKCSCGQGSCPEWAIVELQGVVEAQPTFLDGLHNLQIGILCRHSSLGSYTFTVGYHELTGTKVPLKKPMLVLKKTKHFSDGDGKERRDGDDTSESSVELEVIGIIRHKILFRTRPKALISGPPQPIAKGKFSSASPL